MTGFEVNFDGLVGNTHNYGGLSYGNVASMSHRSLVSNPREAALQGLRKMKSLTDLGLKQAVLPPQQRPELSELRKLGFHGTDAQVIEKAWRTSPELLASCYSASSMWTANAATVTPQADAEDRKTHFTAANLISKLHRSIEPEQTSRILRAIFKDAKHFEHHAPLPASPTLGDEGAANHTRFCESYERPGLELFVFGKYGLQEGKPEPKRFPARQTLEASAAIARLHRLSEKRTFFIQQSPEAIDAGAFHNDVVSVGNRNLFFCHEQAFVEQKRALAELKRCYQEACGAPLVVLEVASQEVSLEDAVRSYLFNSQIVSLPGEEMALIAPLECQERESVRIYLDKLVQERRSPLRQVKFFDLRQSMRNGGGPACLRLRVALTSEEIAASNSAVYLDATLYSKLTAWVQKHYRDQLSPEDLRDPALIQEGHTALDELTRILDLGAIYPFQRST